MEPELLGIVTKLIDGLAGRNRIDVVDDLAYPFPVAVICDALKIAYTTSGRRGQYKDLFDLVSGLGKTINWQMRIGGALRFPTVRTGLQRLHSYWTRLNGS